MTRTISSVPRRRFGRTGLNIPVIPCGTQAFGDAFRPHTLDEAFEIIRHCLAVGINHFDTSRCYSGSLPRLGEAIKRGVVKRRDLIITCRVCRHGHVDYSADATRRWIDEDFGALGIDYADGVFVHDPEDIGKVLAPGGTLEALLKLRDQRVVGAVGLGCNPHPAHLAALETGQVDMLLTFNDYNLLRTSAADAILPRAAAAGVGVLNGWSIVRGILTGEDVDTAAARGGWGQPADIAQAKRIRQWCIERGVSMLALALQFCLRDERIHGNPIAFTTTAEIDSALAAVATPLAEQVWRDFDTFRREPVAE